MTQKHNSKGGQAIILLTFGIIAMMGFVALAIDGGMVYSDRRMCQSVSDSAAMAGGGFAALSLENYHIGYSNFDCSSSDITTIRNNSVIIATNRATSNDLEESNIIVTTICEDNGSGADPKYIDVTVEVQKEVQTSLVHLVYDGPVANSTQATVRVRPRSPMALGNAIVALNPSDCKGANTGATFQGTSDTYVFGGGIWTNGCLRGRGNADVLVEQGGIGYVGEKDFSGAKLNITPESQKYPSIIPAEAYYIPPPDCGHGSAHNISAKDLPSDLSPGLWCISGDVKINAHDLLTGNGVTLYLLNGSLHINGGATVQLTAPGQNPDPAPAIPGVLIMMAPGNSEKVTVNGNSESHFMGTILAVESDIEFTGTGETDTYYTQIIGYNIQLGGTGDLIVTYFDNIEFSTPATIDMYE